MKYVQIKLGDEDFERLERTKGDRIWRESGANVSWGTWIRGRGKLAPTAKPPDGRKLG